MCINDYEKQTEGCAHNFLSVGSVEKSTFYNQFYIQTWVGCAHDFLFAGSVEKSKFYSHFYIQTWVGSIDHFCKMPSIIYMYVVTLCHTIQEYKKVFYKI